MIDSFREHLGEENFRLVANTPLAEILWKKYGDYYNTLMIRRIAAEVSKRIGVSKLSEQDIVDVILPYLDELITQKQGA
jgi:hypothetical protein